MSKARYSKKKTKAKTHSPTSLQNSLELSLENVGMGVSIENKQKARKFNTDHIIFLNIPKFEFTGRLTPKKENFSEKELNSIQSSLENISTNISTSLKKLQPEIEHVLEIQATEDESSIVQEDDYNLNPDKYSADNTHFTSEEEEEEIGKVDEFLSPLNSPTFQSKDSSGEISPDRLSAVESDTSSTRKKNETHDTPVLRKGKSRSSKVKGAKNRSSIVKGTERKKKKKNMDPPADDIPAHIPTNFWPHITPFISPLTFVDIEFLSEKSEELTKEELSLPPLGQFQPFETNEKEEKKRPKSEKDSKDIANSFYTHRLLAALIEDPTTNSHYTFDQYQTFQSSASSNAESSDNLEAKIIAELSNIGLVDDDAKKMDPSQRKDDEICEEIRSTQKQLVELIKLNNQRKADYLQLAVTKMKEQYNDRQLKIKSSHLEKLFSRRMQRNKKRRTKGRTKGGRIVQTQCVSPTRPVLQSLPGKKPHSIYNNNNINPDNNDDEMNNNNHSLDLSYDMSNQSYFDTSQNSMDLSSPKMDYLDDMDTVPPPPEDDMDYDR